MSYKLVPTALRFSLIIPAYNEEAYLPALLDSVDKARTNYAGGPDDIEVVVADNASADSTADLARSSGCRVVREDRRVIAAVRNTGARNARGHVLVFVDADNIMHPGGFRGHRGLQRGSAFCRGRAAPVGPDAVGSQTEPETFQNYVGPSHFFDPKIRPAW